LCSNATGKRSADLPAHPPGVPCEQKQGLRWLGFFAAFVAKTKIVASKMSRRSKFGSKINVQKAQPNSCKSKFKIHLFNAKPPQRLLRASQ